jgi:RNA polymerase I-specific transcription initiation factor RRN5
MNNDSDVSEYVDESDRQPVGRNARPRATKSGKVSSKNADIKQEASRGSSAERENRDGAVNATPQKVKSDILRSYRDLLNSNIAEVLDPAGNSGTDALPPSQIGTSFWTSNEKHRLFSAIQSHGPGNLQALAMTVGTKAEPEIKAYILLLQEGVRELDAKSTQQFGPADVSIAVETEPDLLEAEELLATAIEERARAVEEAREKQQWGEESWLIDNDVAASLEDRYGSSNAENTKNGDVEDSRHEDSRTTTDDEQSDNGSLSSTELLNATTMLQLSRSLFMNSIHPEMNWQTISREVESEQRPSIRRTAFDDFHNLVVSLTRRLIQASLFQALCRLRASSDTRLLPHVNGFDVAAARETMGLKTQRPEYWIDAMKRCGIEVYSDSKKWRTQEGRQGTKNGFKLTEDELRAELGAVLPGTTALAEDFSGVEDDLESSDSDAYTVVSSSENSDDEFSEAKITTDARGRTLTDRRRPLSPGSFNRAETNYLERIDRYNAKEHDDEYRHILGLPATVHNYTSKPGFPYKQAEVESRPADWRAVVQYEAPWEQPQGMPQKRDFDAMQVEGARRRKRRRLRTETTSEMASEQEHETLRDTNQTDEGEAESGSASPEEPGSGEEDEQEGDATLEEEASSGSEAE